MDIKEITKIAGESLVEALSKKLSIELESFLQLHKQEVKTFWDIEINTHADVSKFLDEMDLDTEGNIAYEAGRIDILEEMIRKMQQALK